jgi:hypothetical protein
MNTPENKPFFANSVLQVKSSGTTDILDDLNAPNGKSIAELIYDQEKTPDKKEDLQN